MVQQGGHITCFDCLATQFAHLFTSRRTNRQWIVGILHCEYVGHHIPQLPVRTWIFSMQYFNYVLCIRFNSYLVPSILCCQFSCLKDCLCFEDLNAYSFDFRVPSRNDISSPVPSHHSCATFVRVRILGCVTV